MAPNKNDTLLCPDLKLFKKGKVREVYDFNDKLLIVATDNVSAFDVVLPTLIKGKGIILNQISNFWFDFSKKNIKNHIISKNVAEFPAACQKYADVIRDRSILVWKTEMIELEAIVRGYLSGSGFKDYQKTGQICGIQLPEGLKESAKLETPIFTPSTKAQEGHDINITESELRKQIDGDVIDKVKEISLQLYSAAADYALKRGIIIAD
ncbi:MAG: phosphoribosylaminoimidazolesuccinocarboxamide synthase, partial [Deltaproteobacteria bacterium]|nr:phosphoribosylaminoimidazolesuccinocarboxamide synthase [Deltaproteobacteria bacterium]